MSMTIRVEDVLAPAVIEATDLAGTMEVVDTLAPATIEVGVVGPPGSGGGATNLTVQEGDVTETTTATTLDFADADFDVTVSPAGEANISIAAAIARDSEVTAAITGHLAAAAHVHHGAGTPPLGIGVPGDYWIDTNTGDIYIKTPTAPTVPIDTAWFWNPPKSGETIYDNYALHRTEYDLIALHKDSNTTPVGPTRNEYIRDQIKALGGVARGILQYILAAETRGIVSRRNNNVGSWQTFGTSTWGDVDTTMAGLLHTQPDWFLYHSADGVLFDGTTSGYTLTGVTVTTGTPGTFNAANTWSNDHPVRLKFDGAINNVAQWTTYYVRNVTGTTFQIASTPGGTPIDIASSTATTITAYRGATYFMDPAVAGWQQFFVDRVLALWAADADAGVPRWQGIFLDNVNRSLGNNSGGIANYAEHLTSSTTVRKRRSGVFSNYTNTDYRDGVLAFLTKLRTDVCNVYGVPLWANCVEARDGVDYILDYCAILDGVMLERWATDDSDEDGNPANDWPSEATWNADLALVESIFSTTDADVLCVAMGQEDGTALQQFALASFLLVNQPGRGLFRFTNNDYAYTEHWDYANYDSALGAPLGPRYVKSGTTWRREYEAGYVEADAVGQTSSIVVYTANAWARIHQAGELARDTIANALVAGSNVTITPNDGADTITIAASAGTNVLVQEGDVTAVATASALDFAASDFDVTESPAGEANIAASSALARTANVVAKSGDTMTGPLLVSGSASNAAYETVVTGEVNDRFRVLNSGAVFTHGDDRLFPGDTVSGLTGSASTDVITAAAPHGIANGQLVRLTALSGGAGLNTSTTYYVVNRTPTTFQLAASFGGAAINFTTDITSATIQALAYTGVNRPHLYVEAPTGQSGTTVIVRGSSDTTTGNQLIRFEDYLGAPVAWLAYAGGLRITDALLAVNGVFAVTEQAGFAFRNTNGSGAILSSLDTLSLVFGVSSRVWSGDLVPASRTLGLNISRSSWSFTGSITNGSPTVTVVSGLPDARSVPIGSVLTGITGIPNGTTVTATTSTTITLSANATATNASLTVRIFEPDTLAIRAWNGVEIHGRLSGTDSAAGKVMFDGGLILSGDNDTDGWKISTNDKNLLPPSSGAGGEIGSSSNRLRRLWADILRINTSILPRSGQSIVIGDTSDPISQLVVNDIQGTVNDGWVIDPSTWTRTSATQFTITSATDFTARFQKGTRLRWVDSGGTKYGVVASSSFASSTTTVNLIPTTDFEIASGGSITSRAYSHQMRPQGFPYTFACTTTHTGFSADPTHYARWTAEGNKLTFHYRCTADGTSNATTYTVTAPVAATSTPATYLTAVALGFAVNSGTALNTPGRARIQAGTTTVTIESNMNTTGTWSATGGKRAIFDLCYEF